MTTKTPKKRRDTKQTKTIGEHLVAAELARRDWAPAFTRDGLARTDILAVHTETGRMVQVQVKAVMCDGWDKASWPLGTNSQKPSISEQEYFVLVAVPTDLTAAPRFFVLPRAHVAAATWISHLAWLLEPDPKRPRHALVASSRVALKVFEKYENAWDVLFADETALDRDVRLPKDYHSLATAPGVGLPPEHRWSGGNLPSAW